MANVYMFNFYLGPKAFFSFIYLKLVLSEQTLNVYKILLTFLWMKLGQVIQGLIDPYSQCQF